MNKEEATMLAQEINQSYGYHTNVCPKGSFYTVGIFTSIHNDETEQCIIVVDSQMEFEAVKKFARIVIKTDDSIIEQQQMEQRFIEINA